MGRVRQCLAQGWHLHVRMLSPTQAGPWTCTCGKHLLDVTVLICKCRRSQPARLDALVRWLQGSSAQHTCPLYSMRLDVLFSLTSSHTPVARLMRTFSPLNKMSLWFTCKSGPQHDSLPGSACHSRWDGMHGPPLTGRGTRCLACRCQTGL